VTVFFDYKRQASTSNTDMLLSVSRQIIEDHIHKSGVLPKCLTDLYRRRQSGSDHVRVEDVPGLMSEMANIYRSVYIIVDALDEHSADSRVGFVKHLLGLPFRGRRILVTSRVLPGIETIFQGYRQLRIEPRLEDIKVFVKSQLLFLPKLAAHVRKKPELEEEIIEGISGKAKGM
jgi:hypothetical protein